MSNNRAKRKDVVFCLRVASSNKTTDVTQLLAKLREKRVPEGGDMQRKYKIRTRN